MIIQITYTFLLLLGLSGILYLTEYLHSFLLIDREYTRKIAHVLASLSSFIFLLKGISPGSVIFIALFFSFLLFLGKRKGYFTSIDTIRGETIGSIVLPISILLIYMVFNHYQKTIYFILPLLILAFSDPIAWLTGTLYKHRTKQIILFSYVIRKTYIGSAAFFISAYFISLATLWAFNYPFIAIVYLPLLIAVADTLIELLSPYGTDNLSVPIVTLVMLMLG